MERKEPVAIATLGDLEAHGYRLRASCGACGHAADLDLAALIGRLGAGFAYAGRLDKRLPCSRCGARRAGLTISPAYRY